MGKKLTSEDIDRRIYELVGNEYVRLDEYKNSKTKMLMKHNLCSREYEVKWNHFQGGSRCPNCSGNERLNNKIIDKRIFELTKNEYSRMSPYKNANTKMLMKHNICGGEYKVKWSNFQSGKRCSKCSLLSRSKKRSLNNEIIDRRIKELVGEEFVRLGGYNGANSKMLIRHNVCMNEYLVSWGNFQSGSRCLKCNGNEKLTNEGVDRKIFELVGREYVRLSEYKNNKNKILIKHNICSEKYLVRWNDFQQGKRCPKCSESKGEKKISNLLESLNIKHTTQKRFKDCKYKNTLPFDFYIYNKQSKLLIEFDGIQHYEPIKHFGGEEKLKLTQLRDSIKNKFAQDNNIPLLRISYLEEEDVENIVMNKLKELNFIK